MNTGKVSSAAWFFGGIFLFLVLASCTTVNQPVKEVVLSPKPAPVFASKQVKRQPGSLWSEDSRWNEMYTLPVSRLVGDIVSIKIDEAFKSRIAALTPPELPTPQKDAKDSASPKESSESKDPKDAKAVAKKDKSTEEAPTVTVKDPSDASRVTVDTSKDSKTFEAVIREILPRGVYGVYSSQVLVVDGKTVLVTLDGNVKERDIAASDVAPAENLFNVRMQVENKYSKLREELKQ